MNQSGTARRPVVMAAAKAIISPELGELLAARTELALDPAGPTALARADVFLASSHRALSAADLECATRLAVVTQVGTAVHVDVPAATRLGIPVLHNRGENADSVAEHTIALLLAVAKNLVRGDAEIRSRVHWDVAAPHLVNHELRGKTLGIVGFGAVGRRVAAIASLGLGMRVLGCDAVPGVVAGHGYAELPLDDLLPRVDVLSLHLAATPQTSGLIGRDRLRLLPRHAWLINTARADVLDYDALAEALHSGQLTAAAVDTWPGHRADPRSPLIDLPNVVLSQHNAGFTHEAISRMAQATAGGIWETLAGTRPASSTLVNPEIWARPAAAKRRSRPHVYANADELSGGAVTWEFCTEPDFEAKLEWTRAFVRDEVMPLEVLDLDETRLRELIRPLQEEVRKQGLWAAFLPPQLSGSGWGQVKMALLSEVLGEALWAPTVFGARAPDSGNAELLAIGATVRQRDRYLRPLLDGEIRSCFAMTEPDAGSDPTRIRTTARTDGDGWLINGHKWFASNASVAAFLLVMCVTDESAPARVGQSIFLVPRETPGLTIVRNIPALDDHNPYFHAPQPDQHAEVLLEDVRVTRENLVGRLGQGWELAQARLGPGRIHHCMRWLGQANRAFRMLCERAVSRETAGSRLADKQLIQHYVAQSAAQMQAARLMTLHAAWVIDSQGVEAARTDISMIKFYGSRVLHDVIDRALQVHGSLGYSADMPLEWMYRLARAARIYDGPDEIHEALVARRLLKQFKAVQVPSEHIPTRRLAAERRLGAPTEPERA